jgi:hypothetical protein
VRSRHRRGWAGPAIALALVIGLVAGCGGSDQAGNTSDNANSAGGGANGGGGGGSDEELAWVPFGPGDPTIPNPDWPAYGYFAQGKCSELRSYLADQGLLDPGDEDSSLWQAIAAVCAAAVDGDQDQWAVAATAFAAAGAAHLDNPCLDAVVRAMLQRALDWHEGHPGQRPEVRLRRLGEGGETDCGRKANQGDTSTSDSSDTTDTTDSTDTTDTTGSTDTTGATGTTG